MSGNLLENLNEQQKKAVTTTEGALLVLAGAGSGKTTVLVNRIAYIIEKKKALPYNILAITFTNKAANEMKERISKILDGMGGGMWIGTFHSICVKILRSTIDFLGYSKDFVIYDSSDSKTLVKACLKEMELDEKNFPLRNVMSIISSAKNDMMEAEKFADVYKNDYRMSIIAKLYEKYQKKLKNNNALDFDDIILLTVKILSKNPDVLMKYQARFEYILVDEYQDTNNSQYMLINLLSGGYRNICAVGDDDQSIYKFRGANVGNILSFTKDYPEAKVIRLEQNYRSTQNILDAANAVISNNKGRMGKDLWTDNGVGDKLFVYTGSNEYDEGRFIAREIKKRYEKTSNFADCAILYRTNAQSRVIEEMLMREAIPYRVLAGLRFYDRKEIKDIIAYLRLIHNTSDDLSLRRIINEPKRKIGATTVDKAQRIADENNSSIFDIIENANLYSEFKVSASKLLEFAKMIKELVALKNKISISEFVEKVMHDTGYIDSLAAENSIENQTRIDNLEEFMSVVREFESNDEYNGTLSEFLEGIALISDLDSYDEDLDAVVLMTIHSAKGLEFPVVFLSGIEEGLFPGMRSVGDEESIEEERRLCYVAITRAKERLYLTKTVSRTIFGKTSPTYASRFFEEIPKEYLEEKSSFNSVTANAGAKLGIFNSQKPSKIPEIAKKVSSIMNDKFVVGDIVEHRKFGIGQVISVQEFGNDAILQINVESIGTKQLMAAFAKLKKVIK